MIMVEMNNSGAERCKSWRKDSLCQQPVFTAEGFPQRVVFGQLIQPPADITTTAEKRHKFSSDCDEIRVAVYF